MDITKLTMALTTLALLAAPAVAEANDGTPPGIHELLQDGQDVLIDLRIVTDGEPGLSESYTLSRGGADADVDLFTDRTFEATEAAEIFSTCRGTPPGVSDCADRPEDCALDCDGDGTPECLGGENDGWCDEVNLFELRDDCVLPAGTVTYTLREGSIDYDTETIEVEEEDPSCAGGDADGDGDGDGSVATDAAGGSCAVSGSRGAAPLASALLMIGLGLLAARRARRR